MKKKDWLRITIAAITMAAVVMAFMIAFQGELRKIVEEETDKTILEATEKSATALREKINGDLDRTEEGTPERFTIAIWRIGIM